MCLAFAGLRLLSHDAVMRETNAAVPMWYVCCLLLFAVVVVVVDAVADVFSISFFAWFVLGLGRRR